MTLSPKSRNSTLRLESSKRARQRIKQKFLDFVPSSSRTLQLDIDSQRIDLFERLPIVLRILGQLEISFDAIGQWRSRSGNWHVEIAISRRLRLIERTLIQAALGSDGVRELSNYLRIKKHDPYPILFFERSNPCTTINNSTQRSKRRSSA